MSKLSGKELSDLYPKPKTYEQLKVEQEQAAPARKPRFVAPKIALWSASAIFTVLVAYEFIVFFIGSNLDSSFAVISGVSASFLVCAAAMAVLFYLYTLAGNLLRKTLLSSTVLYVSLSIVLIACGYVLQVLLQNQLPLAIAGAIVLLVTFSITYFVTKFLLKHSA